MSKKQLLFRLTKKDFKFQTFKAGGKGGQHQNKTSSGVRVIHEASGARGESRSERSQLTNKRLAFRRLAETPEFETWLNKTVFELTGGKSIDELVDNQMRPENIIVEVVGEDGNWQSDQSERNG